MRILALEPYYGGSHRAFLDQWIQHSEHEFRLLTLPAHHWKWRMRHAGIWMAEQAGRLWREGARWDAIFCSDMLDLAQFTGLVATPVAALPRLAYFHENQLTYPTRFDGERDLHFALTNFTTALAADQVWFNSEFHRRSWFHALRTWLVKMPDYAPMDQIDEIERKSFVQSPGIDTQGRRHVSHAGPLHIAWAARWEHDKNPETFFDALRQLRQRGIDFRVTLCGQSFRDVPEEFAVAESEMTEHIEHWGNAPSRSDYLRRISLADVFVSTALHEFFGLAVMESIAMGLFPLLPNRLSYPELLHAESQPEAKPFFYDGSAEDLARRLAELTRVSGALIDTPQARVLAHAAERYAWPARSTAMDASAWKLLDSQQLT